MQTLSLAKQLERDLKSPPPAAQTSLLKALLEQFYFVAGPDKLSDESSDIIQDHMLVSEIDPLVNLLIKLVRRAEIPEHERVNVAIYVMRSMGVIARAYYQKKDLEIAVERHQLMMTVVSEILGSSATASINQEVHFHWTRQKVLCKLFAPEAYKQLGYTVTDEQVEQVQQHEARLKGLDEMLKAG